MSEFGRHTYGQPCRKCGFSWDISGEDAEVLIASLPVDFATALAGASGDERFADAPWSVTAYVFHAADNVRIWAERVAARALNPRAIVVPYDQDKLAAARGYDELSLRAGLWALDRAAADWRVARQMIASQSDAALEHPEMGRLAIKDAARLVAHDGTHHVFDVRRALSEASG